MSSISSISSNALLAFSTSQQVTAYNVANLNTDGFKTSMVTFQENGSSGVSANVSGTQDSVDISREATQLLSNKNGFKANLNMLKADDEIKKQLINIKA